MTESQICTLFAAHAEKIQLLEYQLQQKDEEIKALQDYNQNLVNIINLENYTSKGDGE